MNHPNHKHKIAHEQVFWGKNSSTYQDPTPFPSPITHYIKPVAYVAMYTSPAVDLAEYRDEQNERSADLDALDYLPCLPEELTLDS